MAVIPLPAGAQFVGVPSWTPPAQNQVNRSGWTGGRKVVRLPGAARWKVSARVMPVSREVDAWPWIAFFTALEGQAHSFLMPWRECQNVAADPTIGPLGGAVGAETAQLQGMPANARYLRAGQALTFTLPSGMLQLVALKADLVADGLGRGLASFRAPLRGTLAQGAAVRAKFPVCQMTMTGDDLPLPNDEGVYAFGIDAEETFT